mmetsp:Transcript_31055/g.96074  ORF Transcript_31055/g.96074 Transcript_31055/m.96074 type:complete len:170 (+) Transcript_31055:1792-2301(+)
MPNVSNVCIRFTYESVVKCLSCRQTLVTTEPPRFRMVCDLQVCRSCARRCHRNHNLEAAFVRWTPKQDQCGCLQSGGCGAAWSRERAIFDNLVDETASGDKSAEALSMRHFRRLVNMLHPEGITEDDIDSGEISLHSRSGNVTWPAFEKWHRPYFEEVSRAAEADRIRP